MGRTSKNIKLRIPEKPRKIKGFRNGGFPIATTISSRNSISTVGLLISTDAICREVVITVVLLSVLYLLDKFVPKLSLKRNENKKAVE